MKTRKNIRRLAWTLACAVTVTSVPPAATVIYASEESFSDGADAAELTESTTIEESTITESTATESAITENTTASSQDFSDGSETIDAGSIDIPTEEAELFSAEEAVVSEEGIALFADESNTDTNVRWKPVEDESYYISVQPGEKVTLQCKVENPENAVLTYQWYTVDENNKKTSIDGAVNSEYVIEKAEKTARYACIVSDESGHTKTVFNELYIDTGLDTGYGYRTVTAAIGEEVNLVVGASIKEGFGTISYEWYKKMNFGNKENVLLEGETADTLHISSEKTGGIYYCVVKDAYGNKEEVQFDVHVNTGFYVEETSISQKVKKGQAADFTVKASVNEAYASLSYQWYVEKDTDGNTLEYEQLEGECAKTLHIDSAQDSQNYCCFVSDSYGNSEYVYCYLTIDTELKVEKSYIEKYVSLGEAFDLVVNASVEEAFGPLYYTWYNGDEVLVEGINLNTYHISNISKNSNYECMVKDSAGNLVYVTFSIFVDSGLKVEGSDEKVSKKVKKGENVTFSVQASVKEGYGDITYMWYEQKKENFYYYEAIEGQTTDTLQVTNAQKNTEYYCLVEDAYGNRKRVYFEIQIDTGLKVEALDITKYVELGKNVDLVVNASASETLSYCWYHLEEDSYKRLEETTDTLHVTNVEKREEYACVVADSCGNSKRVDFLVRVDTGFKMNYENMETIYFVKPGENVTLKLLASTKHTDGLSYEWYIIGKDGGQLKVNGESDSLTIAGVEKSAAYVGYVHDAYDGEKVTFYVEIPDYENAKKITETEKQSAAIYDIHSFEYFKIEAEKEGNYTFFSECEGYEYPEAYLIDAKGSIVAHQKSSKENTDFEIQKEMHAGDVYYLAVRAEVIDAFAVGTKVEEKHVHKWSDWSVTKEATYIAKGLETRTCESCKATETQEIKRKVIPVPELADAVAAGSSKITVSWKAVSGVDGYRVYRKIEGGNWKKLGEVAADKTSYLDAKAVSGTEYIYTVRAYCKNGKSKVYSSYDKAGKSAVTKAKAPALVGAKALSYNKITVTWKAVSGVDGYRIYRKSGNGSYKALTYVEADQTSYTDKTVQSGVKYTYTVRAYHTLVGKRLLGYYVKAGTSATAKAKAPTLVSAKALGDGKVQVKWKAVSGIDGYRVYRKTGTGSWKALKTVSSKTTSFTDKTVKAGVRYTYTVRAYHKISGNKFLGYYNKTGKSVRAK